MANSVFEYFVPMRDGVKLYTTLQLPEEQGKFPIVIIRSPYSSGRSDLAALAHHLPISFFTISTPSPFVLSTT